jgi:NAD/NADP transhydrogenase alpha subunit
LLSGIRKENTNAETRVALLPENFKPLLGQGISIIVESGAGHAAGAPDKAYVEAGASISSFSTVANKRSFAPVERIHSILPATRIRRIRK